MRHVSKIMLVFFAATLFLTGCTGKIQPKPFMEFHTAVGEVSQKMEKVSLGVVKTDKEAMIKALLEDNTKIRDLYPTFPHPKDPAS